MIIRKFISIVKLPSFLLILFLSSLHIILSENDLSCPDSDIKLRVYHQVTPAGGTSAGKYTKVPEATTLIDCTNACCNDDHCDVAFLFNTSCFLIFCLNNHLCDPMSRVGPKFDESYMVYVKPVDDHSRESWTDMEDFKAKLPYGFFVRNTPELNADFDDNDSQELDTVDAESTLFGGSGTNIKACMYGLDDVCPVNEHCTVKNHRSRNGVCDCDSGYQRDFSSGKCIQNGKSTIKKSELLHSTSTKHTSSVALTSQGSNAVENNTVTTTAAPSHLVVSAGDNVSIQLPENEVTLSAYALPKPKEGEAPYKYEWNLLSHPEGAETGTMQDQNTATLKLSKLTAGIYTFKVSVKGDSASGEATVNVTVSPPKRLNKPPVAVIQPANVTVKLPNKETVLDGSFSTDDDKISKYHWELLEVPIGYSLQINDTPTLQLKNLIPGFYRFKLNVTDSDGATNVTFANVTVQKEMDYPPTANAGSEVVVNMPKNEALLNGSLSTDDKGIKTWEWTKSTDKAVDMEGTDTPYLHLSHLEVGVYKFTLKVTDTADQTATADVHVIVKPESNSPPTANAGPDQHVALPLENPVTLDGQKSKDDIKIVSWKWKQIKGPKLSTIENPDKPVATVRGLIPGDYQFQLTVSDQKEAETSAVVNIFVTQKQNFAPHANAGGDKTIHLPTDVIALNGSQSTDDVGIESYSWTREPSSLAAGEVIEDSGLKPVLKLTGLLPGRYLFRLTVTDSQGVSSSDTASLIVKPPDSLMDEVEIMVNADIKSFTQEQQDTLLRQLELLLHDGESGNVKMVKLDSDRHSHRVIIEFVVKKGASGTLMRGTEVVSRLKRKLRTDNSLLDFEVLLLDTVVCQNLCSSHGTCDPYNKRCVCEAFWMEDMFRAHFGDQESNCDWSILYVIIVSFVIIVSLAGMIWGVACCCTRMRFRKPKKRHRYTLLEEFSDREKENLKLLPRGKAQKSSLMMSESESETLFESRRSLSVKASNGHSRPNGLVKDVHKVEA